MTKWIDDNKGYGVWPFSKQPNKWGYLNNPLWSRDPKAQKFCEDIGLSLNTTDHFPCGHWHTPAAMPIALGGTWWQPSVATSDGENIYVVMQGQNSSGELVFMSYSNATGTWTYYDLVETYPLLVNIPQSTSHNGTYFYYFAVLDTDPANEVIYRVYRMSGGSISYVDVWVHDSTDGIPYDVNTTPNIEGIKQLASAGTNVAVAACLNEVNGVAAGYWQIKVSENSGASFDIEYNFPVSASYTNERVFLENSSSDIFALHTSTLADELKLYKYNSTTNTFDLLWTQSYFTDINSQNITKAILGVSADGNNIIVCAFGNTGNYIATYRSTDGGSNFSSNVTTLPGRIPFDCKSNGNVILIPYNTVFLRSDDYGATFDSISITPLSMNIFYAENTFDLAFNGDYVSFVDCGENFLGGTKQGMLESYDAGLTWSLVEAPLDTTDASGNESIPTYGGGDITSNEPQVWPLY